MLLTSEDVDFDLDIGLEANFVGRTEDLKTILSNWASHKIFGIFGLRSVGKSRLVQEFIKRHVNNHGHIVVSIDCRLLPDVFSLYSNLCLRFQMKPSVNDIEEDRWVSLIVEAVRSSENSRFVFVFDNTEDYQDNNPRMRDSFLSLCTSLVRRCQNVRIFITSSTRVQFAQLNRVFCNVEVLPLNDKESLELLQGELQDSDVELGECSGPIIRLSEGLPLLILMIASELKEDGGMLTPQDMVELLASCRLKTLSREFYPEDDRVADVYRKFIERLSDVYKRRLAVLEYIPGSFTAKQAQQMLDFETEALVKDRALIPIRRRYYLLYDPQMRRFNIQGILRECIQTYHAVRDIPVVRNRYVRTFTEVMSSITRKLNTNVHLQAMSELAVEQPNLSKVLDEVKYVKQDTYNFFIKMATDCTHVIEMYMAGEADNFYEGCLKAADMYGKDLDKASVNIAVGSLYTNTKGNLEYGASKYETALRILLLQNQRNLQLATVYQRLGWNLMLQGKCNEAIRQFDKSLQISSTSGPETQLLMLTSMQSKGVTLNILGRFDEAERINVATLEKRKAIQGENHPSIGALFNNMGLMYDQKGEVEKAIEYFLKGLDIKKKNKAPDLSILASLNNVACVSCGLKRFGEAHKYLDEAEELVNRQKVTPGDPLAYMYNTRANAYMGENKLNEARGMIEKAVEKRRNLSETNPQYLESLAHKAEICRRQKDYNACLKTIETATKVNKSVEKAMPKNEFFKDCLECLVKVSEDLNDETKYAEALGKLESELLRLEREIQVGEGSDAKLEKVRSALEDVKSKLDKVRREP